MPVAVRRRLRKAPDKVAYNARVVAETATASVMAIDKAGVHGENEPLVRDETGEQEEQKGRIHVGRELQGSRRRT